MYRLKPAEALNILFLGCLLAISLFFYGRVLHVKTLVLIYAALLLVQIAVIKNEGLLCKNRATDFAASIVFPVACVLIIFDSLGLLVHDINPRDVDPLLIRLDYLFFGGYPTVMLESFQHPLVTDILQVSYSSYYFLPIALGVLVKLHGKEGEFDRVVFFVLLCFYLSYVGYILFPALGPRYTMNHLQSSDLTGMFVAEPIQEFLNRLEGIKRDAFPSGHTAIVLVVSGLAYRFHRGFFYGTLPVIILLIAATVYCRYHYVVDVIGGVILAAVTFFIGGKYYERWEVRNSIDY